MKNIEIVLNEHTCATHGCGITYWLQPMFSRPRASY